MWESCTLLSLNTQPGGVAALFFNQFSSVAASGLCGVFSGFSQKSFCDPNQQFFCRIQIHRLCKFFLNYSHPCGWVGHRMCKLSLLKALFYPPHPCRLNCKPALGITVLLLIKKILIIWLIQIKWFKIVGIKGFFSADIDKAKCGFLGMQHQSELILLCIAGLLSVL